MKKDIILNILGGSVVVIGTLGAIALYTITGSIGLLLLGFMTSVFLSGFFFIRTSEYKK